MLATLAELRQRAETLRGELAACSSRKLELEGQRTRTDRDANGDYLATVEDTSILNAKLMIWDG